VTAPLPLGSASTVASDASAAAASVESTPVLRVVRIALSFPRGDGVGLTRISGSERPPYGSFTRLTNPSSVSEVTGWRYPRLVTRFPVRSLRLRPGEEHRATLRIVLEPLLLGGETYAVSPPETEAELSVQRATTGDLFRLAFSTRLEGPCMRCLADASFGVEVTAQEYEATDPGRDDELRSEYVVDGELDVGAWARDQIALSLPDRILCRPDCAGLCPTCGKDLNVEPHEHAEATVDPRWAGLEALRTDTATDG